LLKYTQHRSYSRVAWWIGHFGADFGRRCPTAPIENVHNLPLAAAQVAMWIFAHARKPALCCKTSIEPIGCQAKKRADPKARSDDANFEVGLHFGFELFALLFEHRFAAQFDFVPFERQDLDQNLISFL